MLTSGIGQWSVGRKKSSSFGSTPGILPQQRNKPGNRKMMVKKLYKTRLRHRREHQPGESHASKKGLIQFGPTSNLGLTPSKMMVNSGLIENGTVSDAKRPKMLETSVEIISDSDTENYSPAKPKSILRSSSLPPPSTPCSHIKGKKSVTFEQVFECRACNITSHSPTNFINHLKKVHCKQPKNLHVLARAMDNNFQQRVPHVQTPPCSSQFSIQQHVQTPPCSSHFSVQKYVQTPPCSSQFSLRKRVQTPTCSSHFTVQKHCKFCKSVFGNNADLAQHLRKQHLISERDVANYVPLTPSNFNGNSVEILSDVEEEGMVERSPDHADQPAAPAVVSATKLLLRESVQAAVVTKGPIYKLPRQKCLICNEEYSVRYMPKHQRVAHNIFPDEPRYATTGKEKASPAYKLRCYKKLCLSSSPLHQSTPQTSPERRRSPRLHLRPGEVLKVHNVGVQDRVQGRSKIPRVDCSICGRDYSQKYIQTHKLKVHKIAKKVRVGFQNRNERCDICNMSFSAAYIETHKQVSHGSDANEYSTSYTQNFEISPILTPVQRQLEQNQSLIPNGMNSGGFFRTSPIATVQSKVIEPEPDQHQRESSEMADKENETPAFNFASKFGTHGAPCNLPSCSSRPLLQVHNSNPANKLKSKNCGTSSHHDKSVEEIVTVKLEKPETETCDYNEDKFVVEDSENEDDAHKPLEADELNKAFKLSKHSSYLANGVARVGSIQIKTSNSTKIDTPLSTHTDGSGTGEMAAFRRTLY